MKKSRNQPGSKVGKASEEDVKAVLKYAKSPKGFKAAAMIQLTDEMRRHINHARDNGNPCIMATASAGGTPNAGYRGTIIVYDDQSLAYRERGNPRELEGSPRVVLLYRDSATGTGWKFRCTAQVHRDGPVNDGVMAHLSQAGLIQDPQGDGCAVVLRVDQVLTLFGEVLQQRNENLDW